MLWSIFRLIRVASRVGGFNAFVSILDLEVVLQPVGSPVFCWPHLLPFPQQNQCRMRINWCQGLFSLDTSCICGLCSTGRGGGSCSPRWQEGLSWVNLQSCLLCYFQSLLMSCSCRWCFSLAPANMPPIQPEVGIAAFCKTSSQFIKYVQILDFIMCWPVLLMPHASLATSVKSPPPQFHPCVDQLMEFCRNQPGVRCH